MNKKDLPLILILVALILTWGAIDRMFIKPNFFPDPPGSTVKPVESENSNATPSGIGPVVTDPSSPAALPVLDTPFPVEAPTPPVVVPAPPPAVVERKAEAMHVLETDLFVARFSSHGGVLAETILPGIARFNEPESAPVRFDFNGRPALGYSDVPGLGLDGDFTGTSTEAGTLILTASSASGVELTRTITVMPDTYALKIIDRFHNPGDADIPLPGHGLRVGGIERFGKASKTLPRTMGADAYLTGGEGVTHLAKPLSKALGRSPDGRVRLEVGRPFTWMNVKNRFFTQLLTVYEGEMELPFNGIINAAKTSAVSEDGSPDVIESEMRFKGIVLRPRETKTREMVYYIGPSRLSELEKLGGNQHRMVDYQLWKMFRFIEPISALLLKVLNLLQQLPPYNYGLAIILLTIIVRGLFWPLTHKSTENMKRMQALSPKLQEIKQKYKNEPAKQHQMMQQVFKENNINPLSMGCLPMLVQIPVFIGLFGLLRTSVELRFASFLWVNDLSDTEGLLEGKIPLLGELNLLPLAMGLSMFWMQKKTPSTMDPAQQKILVIFMPIFLTFICYHMPAGLLVYWTTSNLMSLYQLMHRTRKEKAAALAVGTGEASKPEVLPPAKPAKTKRPPHSGKGRR